MSSVGVGATRTTRVPWSLRTFLFALLYLVFLLVSRYLVVNGDSGAPPVSLIAPTAGIALVWLASATNRFELVVDSVVLVLLTGVVLPFTGGTAVQTALVVVAPVQYLLVIYLMRRWVPQLWGAGGRASMRALPEFAWVLLAMALGVLVYSFLRTFLGELLIPSETLSLAVGRTTR